MSSLSSAVLYYKKAKLVLPFVSVTEENQAGKARSCDDAAGVCRPNSPETPTRAQSMEEVKSEQGC